MQVHKAQWEALPITDGRTPCRKHGPDAGLIDSEIMTILVMYHTSRFKNFKAFYNNVALVLLRSWFPGAPCYERFLTMTKRVWTPLAFFMASRIGEKTDIYDIYSKPLVVCHNRRIQRHKNFVGLAEHGIANPLMSKIEAEFASPTPTPLRSPAGFDCTNGKHMGTDWVICSSPKLLDIEARLEDAYRVARAGANGERVKTEEIEWIKRYGVDCRLPYRGQPSPDAIYSAIPCVADAMNQRLLELQQEQ